MSGRTQSRSSGPTGSADCDKETVPAELRSFAKGLLEDEMAVEASADLAVEQWPG